MKGRPRETRPRNPRYASLEKQINLRYWPILNFTLLDSNPPIESLQDLNVARYCYATLEVKRLVDKHGMPVLTKIIQDYRQQAQRNSETLFATILKLTGEDLNQRFNRYQDFETLREGREKYVAAVRKAMSERNAKETVVKLQYFDELFLAEPDLDMLISHRIHASLALMYLGHTDYGVDMMDRCIEFIAERAGEKGRYTAQHKCLRAAILDNWIDQADNLADRQIKNHPESATPSRTIKMLVAMAKKDQEQARHWAKMVIKEITDPEEPGYEESRNILGQDPNDVNERQLPQQSAALPDQTP